MYRTKTGYPELVASYNMQSGMRWVYSANPDNHTRHFERPPH